MIQRNDRQPNAERRAAVARDVRLRVVMADDDHNDQLLITMAAEAAGVAVDFVFHDDGSVLLHRLEWLLAVGELPDLVILDLRMPGLDGHRTLAALQAHPVLWQIPVGVFSTSTRQSDEEQALAHGAQWFVTKPGSFDGIVEFVRTLPARVNTIPYDVAPTAEIIDLTDRDAELIAEIERFLETEGA